MKIRGEIRTKKSLSSVKKNINPSIIRYDKNIMNKLESTNTISSVNGGFDTQTVTSIPSPHVTGKHSSTQTIPIIVCLVTMCLLIIAAIIFVFHHRRKFNAEKDENENPIKLAKRTNEMRDIISETTSMSDDDIESKRSSGSSFLAIEVMTNTLSNIIKQQGGKIKISDTNNISATNDLVKVKSLELLENRETSKSSRRVNSFISMANNMFGKSSS
ncbi:hypothetical protein RhiirA5_501116 [Rhizophagus irregularis]|uniref:Uncharacterized protein n=1 Tax=Rhizophagus irregularis TaxID=588596 RepID=A0A2N0PIW5_9GLOM|nr:hypothetical protein RhiirA5_501116 [Rhizophagus irregularis]CAB5138070.1 unnamed protein product [Rhizophagus irregularis]